MTTLEEFSRKAAAQYLQNIVFVDDEIYVKTTGQPVAVTSLLPAFKTPFANPEAVPKNKDAGENKQDQRENHLHRSLGRFLFCHLTSFHTHGIRLNTKCLRDR